MASIQKTTIEELCDFLLTELPDLDCEVLDNINRHKIDGQTFLQLNDDYLKEIAPLLADRIKIKKVITAECEAVSGTISCTPVQSTPSTPLILSRDSSHYDVDISDDATEVCRMLDFNLIFTFSFAHTYIQVCTISDDVSVSTNQSNVVPSMKSIEVCTTPPSTRWAESITIPTRFSKVNHSYK